MLHLTEVLLLVWFFATPVLYGVEQVERSLSPGWMAVYRLNPMLGATRLMRSVLLERPVEIAEIAVAFAGAGALLAVGLWLFLRLSPHFAEAT